MTYAETVKLALPKLTDTGIRVCSRHCLVSPLWTCAQQADHLATRLERRQRAHFMDIFSRAIPIDAEGKKPLTNQHRGNGAIPDVPMTPPGNSIYKLYRAGCAGQRQAVQRKAEHKYPPQEVAAILSAWFRRQTPELYGR